jgi:hypothetical protein
MQRIDAVYHVRGESEFVDDMPPPAEIRNRIAQFNASHFETKKGIWQ